MKGPSVRLSIALVMLLLGGTLFATPAAAQRSPEEVDAFIQELTTALAAETPPDLPLDRHLPTLMQLICNPAVPPQQRARLAGLIAQLGDENHVISLLEPMLFARSELDRTELIRKFAVGETYPYDPAKAITEHRFGPETDEKVKWREITAPDDGVIDLNAVNGAKSNALIYVKTRLHVEHAQPVRLGVRSDDGVEIFVNGRSVFVYDKPRGLNATPDTVDVLLKAGHNSIIYKVYNVGGPWQLSAQWTRMAQAEYDADAHGKALHAVADAVAKRQLKATPQPQALQALLDREHEQVRAAAVRLIGLWRIEAMRPNVHFLASNAQQPETLRRVAIAALGDLAGDTDRNTLVSLTEPSEPLPVRAQAVVHLARLDANLAAERAKLVLPALPKEGDEACDALRKQIETIAAGPQQPAPAANVAAEPPATPEPEQKAEQPEPPTPAKETPAAESPTSDPTPVDPSPAAG